MGERRYLVDMERIECISVVVSASNKREAARKALGGDYVEEFGWDGTTSWRGRVINVERED